MRPWLDESLSDAQRATLEALDPEAPLDYRVLASLLVHDWKRRDVPRVGVGGGQGTGKSTLGRLLESAADSIGLRMALLGLDDFYATRAERRRLASSVHPLLETRGPPGTHDVARLQQTIQDLASNASVEIPVFDKGIDDRVGSRALIGRFDIVVLEGWCVGARALDERALQRPINSLEADRDSDGSWRRFLATRLAKEYAALWNEFDEWVFLAAPGLDRVRRWRLEQEDERPADQRLTQSEIDVFVAHYERVTESMLRQPLRRGETRVLLDEDHGIRSISRVGAGI